MSRQPQDHKPLYLRIQEQQEQERKLKQEPQSSTITPNNPASSEASVVADAQVPAPDVPSPTQITPSPVKVTDMTIYCIYCGTQLPTIASFCLKCGKPVTGSTTPTVQPESIISSTTPKAQPEPRWEYCEVICKSSGLLGFKSYFEARAVGTQGVYIAAQSTKNFRSNDGGSKGYYPDTYSWGSEPLAKAAMDEIITVLSEDGWQPAGKGEGWWEYKFRRQVSSSINISTFSLDYKGYQQSDEIGKSQNVRKPQKHVESSVYREDLLKLLQELFKGNQSVYFFPNIPQKKFINAIHACKVSYKEQSLALLDRTIFGSGKECMLFGTDNLYSRETLSEPVKIPYSAFPGTRFTRKDTYYVITDNQQEINTSGGNISPDQLARILNKLKEFFTNIFES